MRYARGMRDEAALSREILERPWDDGPRLELAALLDGRGDPRGELIRVQIEIFLDEAGHRRGSKYAANLRREKELLKQHAAAWAADVSPLVDRVTFMRGFPDMVKVDAEKYLANAARLHAVAPVVHLDVKQLKGVLGRFFAEPHLGRLRSLLLYDCHIGDEGVEALAASPVLGELRYLDLMLNDVTRRGVEALCASSGLPNLRYVKLTSNPVESPLDRPVAVDNGQILEWEAHPIQEELEARYGHKPWLHYQTLYDEFYPPEPQTFLRP
jgi:uncharacterized protein (TIGR02996 family)